MQEPDPDRDRAREDLALLFDAAEAAGDLAMAFHGQSPQVWYKPDDAGPVTEADLAVNDLLHAKLTPARPLYGWLSEETPDTPDRLMREAAFIIDPIDGTRAFAAEDRVWGHSLAIAHHGIVTAAVVFMPMLGKMYGAALGGGATLNGAPIRAADRPAPDGGTILARKSLMTPANWPGGAPDMAASQRSPMAYRLACVAEGRFDAVFVPSLIWEWDLAGGALLLAESGHSVTDVDGAPLRFNRTVPRAPGVLAANPALHGALVRRRMPGTAGG